MNRTNEARLGVSCARVCDYCFRYISEKVKGVHLFLLLGVYVTQTRKSLKITDLHRFALFESPQMANSTVWCSTPPSTVAHVQPSFSRKNRSFKLLMNAHQ